MGCPRPAVSFLIALVLVTGRGIAPALADAPQAKAVKHSKAWHKTTEALEAHLPRVEFTEVELKDVLEFFQDVTKAKMRPDWPALKKLRVTPASEVNLAIRDLSARRALELALASMVGLGQIDCVVGEDGVAHIRPAKLKRRLDQAKPAAKPTPRQRATRRRLAVAIPNVDFEDAELGDVIAYLRKVCGANVFVDWPSWGRLHVAWGTKVTLRGKDITVSQALTEALPYLVPPVAGPAWEIDAAGVVLIRPGRWPMAGAKAGLRSIDAENAPLEEVMRRAMGGKAVWQVDWAGLKRVGVTPKTPVSLRLAAVEPWNMLEMALLAAGGATKIACAPGRPGSRVVRVFVAPHRTPTSLPAPKTTPAMQNTQRLLRTQTVPRMNFSDIRLADALSFLRDITGLNLVVNWRALADRGIKRSTGITADMVDRPLEACLAEVLRQADPTRKARLGFRIDSAGIVVIDINLPLPPRLPPESAEDRAMMEKLRKEKIPELRFDGLRLSDLASFLPGSRTLVADLRRLGVAEDKTVTLHARNLSVMDALERIVRDLTGCRDLCVIWRGENLYVVPRMQAAGRPVKLLDFGDIALDDAVSFVRDVTSLHVTVDPRVKGIPKGRKPQYVAVVHEGTATITLRKFAPTTQPASDTEGRTSPE